MKYSEAIKKSYTVEWKTDVCTVGEDCWCRTIVPKDPIIVDNEDEFYIIGSGSVPKEYAEYLVTLHNASVTQ
jgi:hypothetical protein